ncbi:MAG TPA: hypothetical protein VII28_05435 [Puia sp.]
MRFTVPSTSSLQQSFDVFHGVRKFLYSKGFQPYFSAISKIEYDHAGKKEIAEVNEVIGINGEMVMLIFECENQFLICTPSRGVAGGEPIIIGRNEIIQISYFDGLPEE